MSEERDDTVALPHPCPDCGAAPHEPCRSQTVGVLARVHYSRVPALDVRCPACCAAVGVRCVTAGVEITEMSHFARILRALEPRKESR